MMTACSGPMYCTGFTLRASGRPPAGKKLKRKAKEPNYRFRAPPGSGLPRPHPVISPLGKTSPHRVIRRPPSHHITSRGDRREDIYFSDIDREAWLALLGQVCARFNGVCHAYCLMSNHYHLVIETPAGNLARGMRQLNGVYTQRVNRTHGRVGHVFQGRYKAILVEKDSYLLALARYVVLNPVRAGMVGDVGDWPWSSYAAMVGLAPSPAWLQTHWLLGPFGRQRKRAIVGYIDFVRAGVGLPSIWDHL
ncbi:transposase [Methylocaldum gracile subsp. desertum]|uniref:transposase n=1 Tax=Methylocaldum sp. GT1BW TaxID=3438964 RepID=UPI003DA1151C